MGPGEAPEITLGNATTVDAAIGASQANGNKKEKKALKNEGKLFVGGLKFQTTPKDLEAYFSKFGKILDTVVMRYPDSGKSRGFGFVTFIEPSDAKSALSSGPHVLNGKRIDIRPFASNEGGATSAKKEKDYKVFLGGLPYNISTNSLKEFFGRYGEVSRVLIPISNKTNKPKGFGFVGFKSEDAAEKCLREGFVHLGGRRVQIKRAVPINNSQVRDMTGAAAEDEPENQDWNLFSEEDFYSAENDLFLTDHVEIASSASENSTQEDPVLGKILENSLLSILSSSEDMNKNEAKLGKDGSFLEDLLAEFLGRHNVGRSSSKENLMSFSDDSESGDSEEDNDLSDGMVDELQMKFMEVLKRSPLANAETPKPNSADSGNDKDCQASASFKFRDKDGLLYCSLCEWCAPKENSHESFLLHCKTPSHRAKLKERFLKEPSQAGESSSKKTKKTADPTPQNPPKNQNKTQPKKKVDEPTEPQKKPPKNAPAKTLEKPAGAKTTINSTNPQDEKITKNLKMIMLSKGMSYIQTAPNGSLQCSICSKALPPSEDFSAVMKSVSQHLQGKQHLNKLMMELVRKSEEKTKPQDKAKNPPGEPPRQAKPTPAPAAEKPKTAAEGTGGPGAKKPPEKNSKIMFFCVLCNYINPSMDAFKAHLKSKSHLNCFASKGAGTNLSLDNLSSCNTCQLFLYGTSEHIEKHRSKCAKKSR